MRWFTDTLKVVLVSIFSFSATAILVLVSLSQDPQPFSVSVAVSAPTGEPESTKLPVDLSLDEKSNASVAMVDAVAVSEKDAAFADSKKIISQKAVSQEIRPQKIDEETIDQEGLVQVLPKKRPKLIREQSASSVGSEPVPTWLRYAATASPGDVEQPIIAIVMDDFGLNQRALEQILELPGPLTLAFLPYADDLPSQSAAARHAGHEVMVHVPMQPRDRAHDPGPNVLDSTMSPADLSARLDWALSRFNGYVGINNHMGSAFTTDPDGMRVVMSSLAARGLLFLDSVTSSDTLGPSMARSAGVPYAQRHVFLDHQRDPDSIHAQLDALEDIARRQGYAVGIGHPHQSTIDALAQWLPTVEKKGIALASVAHVVMRRQAATAIPSVVASRQIDR